MLCPKCKHRNPDENRFCGQCGCDLAKSALTIYPREGYDEADLPPVSEVEPGVPRFGRDLPPLTSAHTEHAQAKRVTESPLSRRTEGIHGPSFLGLADAPDPDFLAELEEPRSHARRNWLLFALALVLVLAFAEWRNLRNSGINLAGTMKLILPLKKGEQPKPPETGANDTQNENGPVNDGKPDMVVNPVNSGAAPDQKSTQGADAQSTNRAAASEGAAQQGTGSPPGATAPTSPSSSSNSAAQPANASRKNDSASPQEPPTADKQQTQETKQDASNSFGDANADTSGTDSATAKEESAPKAPLKSRAAVRAAKSKPVPSPAGEEELALAESAGNPETAARWLWAATSKGNLDAPIRLADMYATGRGIPKDCEQATVLLRSSARRGNPRALARLGMYYATGRCVHQDRAQAWHYLSLAYRHDSASDWIRQYREHLWSRMTPEERARAGNGPTTNASE